MKLIVRSPLGIQATTEALELGKRSFNLLSQLEDIQLFNHSETKTVKKQTITISAAGYINSFIAKSLAGSSSMVEDSIAFRYLDSSPAELSELIKQQIPDTFFTFSEAVKDSKGYQRVEIGEIFWGIYARKGHPTRYNSSLKNILQYPIIRPAHWDHFKVITGEEGIPVKKSLKTYGDECQTSTTALSLAARSDQLVYLPSIAVDFDMVGGSLEKVDSKEIPQLSKPLFMYVHKDRIKNSLLNEMLKKIQNEINQQTSGVMQ